MILKYSTSKVVKNAIEVLHVINVIIFVLRNSKLKSLCFKYNLFQLVAFVIYI